MALSGSFNTSKYNNTIGLTLSWTGTQSIANNQTTIKWTLKSSGGSSGSWWKAAPITVVINGTTVLSVTERFKLYGGGAYKKTGTIVVNHNEDGSKSVAMSVRAAIYTTAVNCTGSKTFTLDKINRYATITDAPDFYDTDNPTITYNNYAGDLVDTLQACISLTGSTDDIAYRDISKTGTSYTFNLTQAERNILLAACPNSNTLSVSFYIKTVIAGQTFYSYLTKTMTVRDANPTITSPTYEDTNPTTRAITNNYQQIIQGQSTVSFNFSTLAALKYATLTSIKITVNAVTVTSSLSGSTVIDKTVAFGTINSSSNLSASIKLTDSRGNITTLSLPITMLAWSLPTAIITCARQNNYYPETDLNVDALYSSLDNKNTVTIQYQYKEITSSSWSALITIQDNVPTTVTLDNTKQWNIKVIVTDRIGSTTYNLTVDRGIPIIFFDRLRRSIGINSFPQNDNSIESDNLQLDDKIYIGSQILLDEYTLATPQTLKVLGSYNYTLIDGLFTGVNVPSGYVRAYRLSAQVTTNNENYASVGINNIQSGSVRTWSGNTMRGVCGSWIFKESDITLEQTLNYSRNGTNLYLYNEGNTGSATFYNVTIHGYLVKSSTTVPSGRAADEDISGGSPAS